MTRTVKDAALMLQAIAGYDPQDAGSIDLPVPDYPTTMAASTHSLRLGIPRAYFYEGLHPEVQAAMEAAISVLKKLTRAQREIGPLASDDTYSSITQPYSTILTAEAYEFHKDHVFKTPELYHPATVKRIRGGADVTISEYMKSRRQLDQIRHYVSRFFENVDLVATPTTPIPPFAIADLADADTVRFRELQMLRNVRPITILGLPTISVPCGFTGEGFPIGMQIIGPPGGEAAVLSLANAYEQATDWHTRRPSLS